MTLFGYREVIRTQDRQRDMRENTRNLVVSAVYVEGPAPYWILSNIEFGYLICTDKHSKKFTWTPHYLEHQFTDRWRGARLQYLQCVRNGDTAILHKASDIIMWLICYPSIYNHYQWQVDSWPTIPCQMCVVESIVSIRGLAYFRPYHIG